MQWTLIDSPLEGTSEAQVASKHGAAANSSEEPAEAAAEVIVEERAGVSETLAVEAVAVAVAQLLAELFLEAVSELLGRRLSEGTASRAWTSRSNRLQALARVMESKAALSVASANAEATSIADSITSHPQAASAATLLAPPARDGAVRNMGTATSMRSDSLSSTLMPPAAEPADAATAEGAPFDSALAVMHVEAEAEEAVDPSLPDTEASTVLNEGEEEAGSDFEEDSGASEQSTGVPGDADDAPTDSEWEQAWERPIALKPWSRFASFVSYVEPWNARAWWGLPCWQAVIPPWLRAFRSRKVTWSSLIYLSIRLRSCRRRLLRNARSFGIIPTDPKKCLHPSTPPELALLRS